MLFQVLTCISSPLRQLSRERRVLLGIVPAGLSRSRKSRKRMNKPLADIHGKPVFILGIDKDKSALKQGPVGCKILGGNAVQLTREWVDVAFANARPFVKERLYRSFMVEIPAQETEGDTIESRLISGISGSEAWVVVNGRKTFAGIFHMAHGIPGGKGLAFFYPASVVREQYEHYMRNVAAL